MVIANGKIAAIGDAATIKIPDGAKVLDLSGRTVIPGLVGMHDHMFYPAPGGRLPLYPEHAVQFPAALSRGRRHFDSNDWQPRTLRGSRTQEGHRRGENGRSENSCHRPLSRRAKARSLLQMHQLRDAEDARQMVEFWIARGATSFKAYMNITPDELSAAIKAAHAHGIKVTGHLCSIGFREAAALGIDDLEHGIEVDTEFLADKKPGVCPNPRAAAKALLSVDIASKPMQDMIHDLVSASRRGHFHAPCVRNFRAGTRAAREARARSHDPRSAHCVSDDTRANLRQRRDIRCRAHFQKGNGI